jgi:hypothetical protein
MLRLRRGEERASGKVTPDALLESLLRTALSAAE